MDMSLDLDSALPPFSPSPRAISSSSTSQGPHLFRQPPELPRIPSLAVDYEEQDASDPELQLNWFQSLAVFGFSERDPDDPRNKALAKLKLLTARHGIGDLKLIDYYRAFLVHSAASAAATEKRTTTATFPTAARKTPSLASKSAPELPAIPATPAKNNNNGTKSPTHSSGMMSLPSATANSKASAPPPKSPSSWRSRSLRNRARRYFGAVPKSAPTPPLRRSMEDVSPLGENTSTISDEGDVAGNTSSSTTTSSSTGEDDDPTTVTADHVRLVYHMLRHAESIYGLPLTIASAPLVSLRKLSGQGIVAYRNGLSDDDIMHSRFTASTFMPANYVAVDRSINAIVVCVRGTANLLDSLTDVAATYDPLRVRRMCPETGDILSADELVEGYGHYGVLRSARSLFEEIRVPTLVALRENPTFELLITGHSLGGAIAAVLSLIMRDDDAFPHALAVCIAPPPCLSWDLAEETMTTAIAVVNGADIVPRLSIPVLLPYLATARYVADLPPARRALVGWGLPTRLAVEWDEVVEACENRVVKLREMHAGKELFIPGACFHLRRRKARSFWSPSYCGNGNNEHQVEMLATDRRTFCGIKGREKGMFTAHAPLSYRAKLREVLRTMKAPKYGKANRRSKAAFLRHLTTVPRLCQENNINNNSSLDAESDNGDNNNNNNSNSSTNTNSGRSPTPAMRKQASAESVDGVVKDLFRRAVSQRGGTYAALDSPRKRIQGRRISTESQPEEGG